MNRFVKAIATGQSLRPPLVRSLEILDRVCELAPPKKDADRAAVLAAIQAEFPSVKDFEREFPSLCFAIATGVGKTRLMGAFVSYLYLAHGFKNFFVLAPNLTIYNKLITDFTPNTPKYVFKGVPGFAIDPPVVITGDNYDSQAATIFDKPDECKVNIFNISKINSEVRGGKAPRIKRLSEYIGESYFEYLAKLPDLVMLMDESHRYRASAGVRAINDLKPILGLELTATPFVETTKGPIAFKNIIFDYALGAAMRDGFVKEPAVVTRKDFNPAGVKPEEIERIKLEDGVRLHEQVKVELATYANNNSLPVVKPFVLVIARDTTHAKQLLDLIQNEKFFDGRYEDRVIQVDSSKTGKDEDEMIERLLKVESTEEPTEIVIHVNMLKEGWDVTNLYTIIPLRAANARVLIEQSIGRGLRLPYGKRTGVRAVDWLNIIAHDRFSEVLAEAQRMDSLLKMQSLVLDSIELASTPATVVSKSGIAEALGYDPATAGSPSPVTLPGGPPAKPLFDNDAERQIGNAAYIAIQGLQSKPNDVPTVGHLQSPANQAKLVAVVKARLGTVQQAFPGLDLDIEAVVAKATEFVVRNTIDIPRILVVPKGEVRSGYKPFTLNLTALSVQVPSDEIYRKSLHTGESETLELGVGGIEEKRLEDYVVRGLVDFDDVSYDDQADFLYDLATQTVNHLRTVLNRPDTDLRKVLQVYQRVIAEFIHSQMLPHYWEETTGYEVIVSRGFTELKESAYTTSAKDTVFDFRHPPADKGKIGQYLYTGFERCLYRLQKFQADTERKMAVILDRDSLRWFRPARSQFQIFYKIGHDQQEYQPDFVAEADGTISMIETKAASSMTDADVVAKRDAGVKWCANASDYARLHGGKPWLYLLIPHDVVAENMTLNGLAGQYAVRS